MAEIKFENVSKSFGKTTVIENMNLTLPDGKFTVLLGPSGCGKTTLLRMIAGIGPESSGTVYMNGKRLKKCSSRRKRYCNGFSKLCSLSDNVCS